MITVYFEDEQGNEGDYIEYENATRADYISVGDYWLITQDGGQFEALIPARHIYRIEYGNKEE